MSAARTIRWNHLGLSVPAAWETIVKGPFHLIFEHDLTPTLELRWQQLRKKASPRRVDSILKQFDEPCTVDARREALKMPESVVSRYEITVLHEGEDRMVSLLLVCRSCGTAILAGLHRLSPQHLVERTPVLESLRCCPRQENMEPWRIQDFFFSVPRGFTLDAFSFKFGGSDLRFTHKHGELRVCRLAPASVHLTSRTFAELFASFCNAAPGSLEVVDARTLHYRNSPGAVGQLWQRIRRKRLFRRAVFSHFPDHDRILGLLAAGDRAALVEWATQRENGYGIIAQTETTDTDP